MDLEVYKRKRDFRNTPEPRGKVTRRKAHQLSYVVQKHAARNLHYDFRLELNGVLLSWAVPKGPSLDPAEKRLAIHVEDHPLDYGEFEGLIPPKQYGSGAVMVWDRGTWLPKGDPERGYADGHLKFDLQGDKLNGGWVLVRTRGSKYGGQQGDKAWLLIKENDQFARRGPRAHVVDEAPDSVLSGRDIEQIARAGDRVWESDRPVKAKRPRAPARSSSTPAAKASRKRNGDAASINLSNIEGAKRARLPATLSPMLATLVSAVPAGDQWLHEMKYDGYRMLCCLDKGSAAVHSRNGKDWTRSMQAIAKAAEQLRIESAWLDGEIAVVMADGRTSFQALQNALDASEPVQLTYFVFDLPYLNGYDLRDVVLIERKRILEQVLRSAPPMLRFSEHVLGSGQEFFSKACSLNLEGAISKRLDSSYRGARSRDWVKVKCSRRQELVIGGFTEPQRTRSGLGALLLGVHEPGVGLRYAGKVGTGFDRKNLGLLRSKLDALERKSAPFVNPPKGFDAKGVHWVKPELVAEVSFAEWTAGGTLRQASFKGLREDKSVSEVVREEPQPRFTASRGKKLIDQKSKRTHRMEADRAITTVADVQISHADKLLYPDAKLSKLDLARYYEAIGQWILPHLKNRPLSLLRCPDGWKAECFYQKHADKNVHSSVGRVEVPEGSGSATYMMIKSLTGLMGMVQWGVLELHPWGSQAPKLDRPDRLIFDFDPHAAIAWKQLVEAVQLLRSLLEELGLIGFLKTTGGKGLHVVVPIRASLSWDQAKRFAKATADLMVHTYPDRFIATASKSRREGLIFVDHLRNAQGATAVCAYSPRARANAPVATPITWEELDRDVRFDHFNVRSVPVRLDRMKADPWAGFFDVKQSVGSAMLKRMGVR